MPYKSANPRNEKSSVMPQRPLGVKGSTTIQNCQQIIFKHVRWEDCVKRDLKLAIGRPCVLALVDSGTVSAFTCDCFRVADVFMRRRYFDLCVSASSRTMLVFENNVSCSSSACSTLASNLR